MKLWLMALLFLAPVMANSARDCNCHKDPSPKKIPASKISKTARASEKPAKPAKSAKPAPIEGRCTEFEALISRVVPRQNVICYSKLFAVESTCQPYLHQPKGHVGNPAEGFGLCTIEFSPAVRKTGGRGPKCENLTSVIAQIQCCVHLMKSTKGRYFGSVRDGKVPRCG